MGNGLFTDQALTYSNRAKFDRNAARVGDFMPLTAIAEVPEATVRDILKKATEAAHRRLENTHPMRALMGPHPDRPAVCAAIVGQVAVIDTVERRLDSADPTIREAFADYRRRAPLARADLHRLNHPAGWTPFDATTLTTPAAWLGFRYVVEGSSLGGALIRRHLAAHAPTLPSLAFFDPHGFERGAKWRRFCATLDRELTDAQALDEAIAAANAIFADLHRSLEEAEL
jgi:heme oxygenase